MQRLQNRGYLRNLLLTEKLTDDLMDFTSSIFNSQFLILITDENLPLDMVLVVNIHASHLGFFGNTDSGFEADIQFCKWTPK